ncbi:MAG: hypothetical protein JXR63_08550 [Spirochaetales bacterium]|nr:hypothetical protein [Spirochaetales bacterium]
MIKRGSIYIFTILVLLFVSCESSAPEISVVHWQLILVNDLERNIQYEKLSVFLQASDEDGEKDLDQIYVINDENELYWEIGSAQWTTMERDGSKWYGYSDFTMYDKSPFPRGKYRFMVTDVSGERDEKEIFVNIDRLDPAKIKFPSISVKDEKFYVDTEYENVMTIIYDANNRYINGNIIEYDVTPIREFPDFTSLYAGRRNKLFLYVVTDGGYGLLNGPYKDLIQQ